MKTGSWEEILEVCSVT